MIDQHLQIQVSVQVIAVVVIVVVAIAVVVVAEAVVEVVVEVAVHTVVEAVADGSIGAVIVFLVAFGIVYAIIRATNKNNRITYSTPATVNFDDNAIENKVKQYIPNFNKKEFLDNGYKMYCDIQEAWMNFKLEDVRNLITDELFTMYESQLSTLEVKGEQNIMKDFVLKSSRLKDVAEQNGTITISTIYVIEFYDYIADVNTGKTIRGESKRKMRVTYEMKFQKSLDSVKIDRCPNCGAKIEEDSNGAAICKYCGSKLVYDNMDWVLTDKKVLYQRDI